MTSGFATVVFAGKKEELSGTTVSSYDSQGNVVEQTRSGQTSYKEEKVAGYTAAVLFGASAIYGFVVEAQCSRFRRELEQAALAKAAAPKSAPLDLPKVVAGFAFGITTAQAEQACVAKQQAWALNDSVASCRWPKTSTAPQPDVLLSFRSDRLTQIAVDYYARGGAAGREYDRLDAMLRTSYGKPQVEGSPSLRTCKETLNECLTADQNLQGPVWRWASGSIEVAPLLRDQRVIFELRYSHGPTPD